MSGDAGAAPHVVVVGAGAAGCVAALRAAELGAQVTVLEKEEHGATIERGGGWIFAAGTRWQAAAGIADSPEQFAADVQAKNGGTADPEVLLALTRASAEVAHWLADTVGVPLVLESEAGRPDDPHLTHRCLVDREGRGGPGFLALVRDACARHPRIDLRIGTGAAGLIAEGGAADAGGAAGAAGARVTGVTTSAGATLPADAVILAAGGFGASRERIARWIPEAAGMELIGGPGNTGEAIEWGAALGAGLAHMTSFQGHAQFVKGALLRLSPGIPNLGGIFVNAAGERFAREDVNYSAFSLEIARQPGGEAVEIFDERIRTAVAGHWMMKVAAEQGLYATAATPEELAAQLGLPVEALAATLEAYAEACRSGHDPLGRTVLGEPLRAPFHAARIVPVLAHTQGGLVVDASMRVQRASGGGGPNGGGAIAGLLAVGGTMAGLSGDGADGYYSGNGLLAALCGGWLAAATATDTAPGDPDVAPTAPR